MTATVRSRENLGSSLISFAQDELRLTPVRLATMARMTIGSLAVLVIAMTYQIPLPAYTAYLVITLSHDDPKLTLKSSLGGALAATVAVGLSILFYMVDADEPALRFSLMALSSFGGLYLVNMFRLGPVAFLAAFILVLSQTLIDRIASVEALTHMVLWLWVVAVVPAAMALMLHLIWPSKIALPPVADPTGTKPSQSHAVQFALKTTLAIMVCYSLYSAADWPEFSTSITTCFFVAQASLGKSLHKMSLRLGGAIIGGLLGAFCLVFILPHLDDIGQFCLLIGAVTFACAWIATASDRIAYAGMQVAFAFYLGVMQGYGPTTELTVLRDRCLGILLGNIVLTLVFMTLWPQPQTSDGTPHD